MTTPQSFPSTSVGLASTVALSETPSKEVAVSCRGITVRYDRTVAVDEATFDACPGEVLGLLDPNGAGKTSAIRALTTILPLAAGEGG